MNNPKHKLQAPIKEKTEKINYQGHPLIYTRQWQKPLWVVYWDNMVNLGEKSRQTKRNTNNPQCVRPPSSDPHDLSHHESYFKPYSQFNTPIKIPHNSFLNKNPFSQLAKKNLKK